MSKLEQLSTTDSGHVVKRHAIKWLADIDEAIDEEIQRAVVPKPKDFSGSKYATEISVLGLQDLPSSSKR